MLTGEDGTLRHDLSFESVRAQLSRDSREPNVFPSPYPEPIVVRYLVKHTLEGNAEQLKEYSLGAEVFDRGESFDPRTDTIVRVQARRLRSKLGEYYDAEGQADPVVIELPKGHYVVTFRTLRRIGPTLHLVEDLETHPDLIDEAAKSAPRRLPVCRPHALL